MIFLYYCIFLYFSVVIIGIGFYKKYKNYKINKENIFQKTIGTVVDYKVKSSRGSKYFYSIIKYVVNEKEYTFVQKFPPIFKQPLGKEIEIMYNPDKPTEVIEKNDYTWLRFLIIGVILLILAVFLLIISNSEIYKQLN